MKKAILVMVIMFALTGSAFAAPLMDYSQGKFAIDYTYRPNADADISQSGSSIKLDSKTSDFGITAGLGNKFAFQIRHFKPNAFTSSTLGPSPYYSEPYLYLEEVNAKLKSTEFNLMYKLDDNLAAFAGVVKGDFSGSVVGTCVHPGNDGNHPVGPNDSFSEKKNMFQAGLVGTTKLSNNFTLYGVAAAGKDYRNLEAGLSYALDKNVDLDLNYRSTKYKNIGNTVADNVDVTYKGLGFGVTYKF